MSTHESLSWADRPEPVPMGMTLEYGGRQKKLALTIGNCAIALFRKRPEMDYLAVQHQHEEETRWTYIFNKHALIYWMGNLALTTEGKKALSLANRTHGTFYSRYNFNPDVVVEDYPHEHEVETYIQSLTEEDIHADLNNALKEEFEG